MSALVAQSGKCLRGEGLVWLFASYCRASNCSFARTMDGRISAAAPLALANQLPLLMTVKRGWSGFVPVRRAII